MIRFTTETATIYQQAQSKKDRTEKQKENEDKLRFQVPKPLTPAEMEAWIQQRANITKDFTPAEMEAWIQANPEPTEKKGKYNGFVSAKTAREVARRVSNIIEIAPKARRIVTFTTLTLPTAQKHSDNFVKRHLLGNFLEVLKKKYGLKNFIWKAEAQKNGNIHFHIMADTYLPNKADVKRRRQGVINELWNSICARHGYLDNYKRDRLKQYKAGKMSEKAIKWNKAFNFSVPNSTDVHELASKVKPESYINKYISKPEPGRRIIEGRIIGSSETLKQITSFSENENNSQSGFDSYYSLKQMAANNPKEVLALYIDVDNKIYTGYRPPSHIHIVIEKYFYPPKLWELWAPPAHKVARYEHFKQTARAVYG